MSKISKISPETYEACLRTAARIRKSNGFDFIPARVEFFSVTDNGSPVYKVFGSRNTKKPAQDGGLFGNLFEQAESESIEDWLYVWSWQIN